LKENAFKDIAAFQVAGGFLERIPSPLGWAKE